jgi:adenylate kinase family enzyme
LIHLDRHYWQAGWIASTDDAWDRVAELAQADEWVMDGNYSRTLEPRLRRADVAILLDPPTIQCVGGVLRRMWLDRRKARPDLATGCVERMVPDPQFLYYVATYKRRSRPKVLRRIRDVPRIHFIHLHRRRDARAFLNGLSDKAGRA